MSDGKSETHLCERMRESRRRWEEGEGFDKKNSQLAVEGQISEEEYKRRYHEFHSQNPFHRGTDDEIYDFEVIRVDVDVGYLWRVQADEYHGVSPIFFCPFCGTKLE